MTLYFKVMVLLLKEGDRRPELKRYYPKVRQIEAKPL